jgi:hypothetical protein
VTAPLDRGCYIVDAPRERTNSGNMSISAVVVRSLTTQARSQKVPSAHYARQLQSFHYHIARLATGSFLVCVAGGEKIASNGAANRAALPLRGASEISHRPFLPTRPSRCVVRRAVDRWSAAPRCEAGACVARQAIRRSGLGRSHDLYRQTPRACSRRHRALRRTNRSHFRCTRCVQ